jgi:hypothetical protein
MGIKIDRTWLSEEGEQGDWYWYSEGSGYTVLLLNGPARIDPKITKWCHDNFTAHNMRFYPHGPDPGQNNALDEIWFRTKKELSTFLLWWG